MPLFRKPPPDDDERERTPAQRAAEREERERRRAERAGRPYTSRDEPPSGLEAEPSTSPQPPEPAPAPDPPSASPPPLAADAPEPLDEPEAPFAAEPAAPVPHEWAGGEQPAPLVSGPPVQPPQAELPHIEPPHMEPPPVEPPRERPPYSEPAPTGTHEVEPAYVEAHPVQAPYAGAPDIESSAAPAPSAPVPSSDLPPEHQDEAAFLDPLPGPPSAATDGVHETPAGDDDLHHPAAEADDLHAPTAAHAPPVAGSFATDPPSSRPLAVEPQPTAEHAALEHEHEHDDWLEDPDGHEAVGIWPETGEIDQLPPPPVTRAPAGGASRIPPPPTRRDALLHRRAGRLERHRTGSGGPRRLLRPARIAALVALVLLAAALWFLVSLFQPLKGSGHGRVVVVIPRGSGAKAIGDLLASRGVVASGFFFDLRAAVDGKRGQLHSGVYTFERDMSYGAAIGELVTPPPPPPVVRVLVAEGEARAEIAPIVRTDGLTGDYLAATRRSTLLDPTSYGAPRHTPHLEGFLWPATYDLKAGNDVKALVDEQLTAFKSHFGPGQASAARALHVSLYDVLIVASMIEREALLSRDRPLVAAVIYNRLRQHVELGIDATIRYALNKWSSPLTESDLHISSPYNTRTHQGLPPTPINNPGMASIDAATHPAHTADLYYVDGSDGCGDLKFSTSFAQFQADSAAYQAALAHNGGRVPTCKKK